MKDRAKKAAFSLLTLALIWGVVELAAVAGHAFLDGRLFSPRTLYSEADDIAARQPVDDDDGSAAALEEAVARMDDPFERNWSEVIHPYIGVVLDPTRHAQGAISDLGFRSSLDADELIQPDKERTVIGVFGGSFAGGVYHQLARAALDRRLTFDCPTPGKRCRREKIVVNFAKGGYKQPQQVMALTYLLALGVEFDVVVNVDGFNEVALPPAENVPREVNPFFPRQWHQKARGLIESDSLRQIGYLEYLDGRRRHWAGRLLDTGLYRSPLGALLWRSYDRTQAAKIYEVRQQAEQADVGRVQLRLAKRSFRCLTSAGVPKKLATSLRKIQSQSFDRREQLFQAAARQIGEARANKHRKAIEGCTAEISTSYAARGPRYEPANREQLYRDLVGMWERSSLEMHALCEAYGIEYFHFLQPNQYVEGSKRMTREERRIAINESQNYQQGVIHGYPLLSEAGRRLIERGVAFSDLTMLLEQDDRVLYIDDCCHLNKEGYSVIVDEILETVEAALTADNPRLASARAPRR